MQEAVAQYSELAADLERLLPGEGIATSGGAGGVLDALPAALGNLHDLLLGTAARLEALHERVQTAKDAFLQRRLAVRALAIEFGHAACGAKKSAARARGRHRGHPAPSCCPSSKSLAIPYLGHQPACNACA